MIEASQIRAGRALVKMSQSALAEAAGISVPTVKRIEAEGPGRSSLDTVTAIKEALEAAGVVFIAKNGGGAGVRLKSQEGK